MAEVREFLLPDVGEGLTEAEVLTWHVAVGDHVTVNQVLVEIETAKAAVELPSPYAGVVMAVLVGYGVAPSSATRRPRRRRAPDVEETSPGPDLTDDLVPAPAPEDPSAA